MSEYSVSKEWRIHLRRSSDNRAGLDRCAIYAESPYPESPCVTPESCQPDGCIWDKQLSPKQRKIIAEIQDYQEHLSQWHGLSSQELEDREDFRTFFACDYEDWSTTMRLAVNAGLEQHPFVWPWYQTMRTLGKWDELRRSKRARAEKGVKRPLPEIDKQLRKKIINSAREQGSLTKAQEDLIRRREIPHCSRNAFYELRKRLNIPKISDIRRSKSSS
jgi:hypothetical protein